MSTPKLEAFGLEVRRLMFHKEFSRSRLANEARIGPATITSIVAGRWLPKQEVFASLRAALAGDEREAEFLTILYEQARMERRQLGLRAEAQSLNYDVVVADGSVPGGPVPRAVAFHGPVTVTGRSRKSSGPAPDPILFSTAGEFVGGLRDVHLWAMEPSLRDLEQRSLAVTGRRCPRSTLSNMLNSATLPRWDLAQAFLELCGVRDTETWSVIWRRIKAAERTARVAG